MVGVGEEREVEHVVVGERAQPLDGVAGDAEHDRVGGLVVGRVVTNAAGLGGAARRVGLGIEVDDDGAAAQLRQRDRLAVLVGEGEVGCGLAWLDHRAVLLAWVTSAAGIGAGP